jgi:hypothetical protein
MLHAYAAANFYLIDRGGSDNAKQIPTCDDARDLNCKPWLGLGDDISERGISRLLDLHKSRRGRSHVHHVEYRLRYLFHARQPMFLDRRRMLNR